MLEILHDKSQVDITGVRFIRPKMLTSSKRRAPTVAHTQYQSGRRCALNGVGKGSVSVVCCAASVCVFAGSGEAGRRGGITFPSTNSGYC